MNSFSQAKITVPRATPNEIIRSQLIDRVIKQGKRVSFINAGPGYGKTTLLAQIAQSADNSVWVSMDGENELSTFMELLTSAFTRRFPHYHFAITEYLPFEGHSEYLLILANAFINSIELLELDIILIIDDLHTVDSPLIKQLIISLIKYQPDNLRLCLGSREIPWPELLGQRLRGNLLEITSQDLAFTPKEANLVLGFNDEQIYQATEGWPLAIKSMKIMLENGTHLDQAAWQSREDLYNYLFYECTRYLAPAMMDFLIASACFTNLDARMLDAVLQQKNSQLMLDSLTARNIFTVRTGSYSYRYHPLFRDYLLNQADEHINRNHYYLAAVYYLNQNNYQQAADYAINSHHWDLLQDIILVCYRDEINKGNFAHLRHWFKILEPAGIRLRTEVLVAKGVLLSNMGDFIEANNCFEQAFPHLDMAQDKLYLEAMVHHARVLRNFESFAASDQLLDRLLSLFADYPVAIVFEIVMEKLYNLCWSSQVKAAEQLAEDMIVRCLIDGDIKTKSWLDRQYTAIHFFAGRMKDTIVSYEQSLELPLSEQAILDRHSIGMFAAKAYQMMGQEERAISLITSELEKLRGTGRYEDLWAAYGLAAEIHYHAAFARQIMGHPSSYDASVKYLTLADEYAALYRKTDFQRQWASMQRLMCSLILAENSKEAIISQMLANLDSVGIYLQSLMLGRLIGYWIAVGDYIHAVTYARKAVDSGESTGMMLIAVAAYGVLARAAIAQGDQDQALDVTTRYLQLCQEYGVYEYFRLRPAYDPVLEFACQHKINPEFTEQMMILSGYQSIKAFVTTLGEVKVTPYHQREYPIKLRTKKERELLVYLLTSGKAGVTKERIIAELWFDSEAEDLKKLVGVNLAQIKRDFSPLGLDSFIIFSNGYYHISRNEMVADIDLLDSAINEFDQLPNTQSAQTILSLYQGEFMAGYEALWATARRIRYQEAVSRARQYLQARL